jgi:hypothetical protein
MKRWQRDDVVARGGWATLPGTTAPAPVSRTFARNGWRRCSFRPRSRAA